MDETTSSYLPGLIIFSSFPSVASMLWLPSAFVYPYIGKQTVAPLLREMIEGHPLYLKNEKGNMPETAA